MSKRAANQKLKLCVLSKIKEHKEILFGAFSDKLTKEDKVNCWKELSIFAQSIGVLAANREWSYLRDVWWPNVKKLTVGKIDNAKSTGSGGGKDKILTDVDNEVINIIGKDSPVIVGLNVPESMEDREDSVGPSSDTDEGNQHEAKTSTVEPTIHNESEIANKRFKPNPTLKNAKICSEETKRQLQILLLKQQLYKTKLECRKLEMELGYFLVADNNCEVSVNDETDEPGQV